MPLKREHSGVYVVVLGGLRVYAAVLIATPRQIHPQTQSSPLGTVLVGCMDGLIDLKLQLGAIAQRHVTRTRRASGL